jgi:hypothetical protein
VHSVFAVEDDISLLLGLRQRNKLGMFDQIRASIGQGDPEWPEWLLA